MRKFFITFFILLSCYVLWPYLAVFNLYVALKTGNTGVVEEHVDWIPLKEGLTKDLDQLVARELKKNLKMVDFSGLKCNCHHLFQFNQD